jgi:hypothetical protein
LQIIDIFSDQVSREENLSSIQQIESLKKQEFLKICDSLDIRLSYFTKLSTLLDVEFQLKTRNPDRELEVPRAELDNVLDLKEFLQIVLKTSDKDDQFFLLSKKFWIDWTAYVGL